MASNSSPGVQYNTSVYFSLPNHISTSYVLGSGSYSIVYLGYDKQTQENVAIKVIDKAKLNATSQKYLAGEISLMRKLDRGCENVLRLYDVTEDQKNVFLVLEYCSGGDLQQLIKKHKTLDETAARHFFVQLVSGLQFLDANKVMHRDLKPQNLLLTALELDATLKLADFGFARLLDNSNLIMQSMLGSPLYMSPEVLNEQPYDRKSDMWSVGVILHEMLFGRSPWPQVRTQEQLRKAQRTPLVLPKDTTISSACADCLQRLLTLNRDVRITLAELIKHPFVNGYATVQVRHVTSTHKALQCPTLELDIPASKTCKIDDVANLLAARLNVPVQHQLLIVGPPQKRPLASSVDDLIGTLVNEESPPAASLNNDCKLDGNVEDIDAQRRNAPIAELLPGHLLSSYNVIADRRALYVFDKREMKNVDVDKDGFQFVPLPVELTTPPAADVDDNIDDERLGDLLDFHRQFTANFKHEQTLKRVCDFTYQQCRLCIGQLHVLGAAPRVAAHALTARHQRVVALLTQPKLKYLAGKEESENIASLVNVELDAMRDIQVPIELFDDKDRKNTSLLSLIDEQHAQHSLNQLKSVNTQLAALFDAAAHVDRAVAQAVHEANAAGVLDLSPYVERLRKAHAWCGEVRTYYQVFQKHFATVEARVAREKAAAAKAPESPLGWSLISDGFQQIGDIHSKEVDTSRKHLDGLNEFQADLTRYMRPLAHRVQPLLHAAFVAMQNLTQLVNDAKDIDKLLSKRTELTNELTPMINTRRAYIAALKECVRRQRADTQLHSMQASAKRAFLEQATAERASRQAFALLHGASVSKLLFGGFDGSDSEVQPVRVVSPSAADVDGGLNWKKLDVSVARASRQAALDVAPLPQLDGVDTNDDDDDEFDEEGEFEHIERSVAAQDGAVRLLQLERENRRLRAALQLLATRRVSTAPTVDAALDGARRQAVAVSNEIAVKQTQSSSHTNETNNNNNNDNDDDDDDRRNVVKSNDSSSGSSVASLPPDFGPQLAQHMTEVAALGAEAAALATANQAPSKDVLQSLLQRINTINEKHSNAVQLLETHMAQLQEDDDASARQAAQQLLQYALSVQNELVVVRMQLEMFSD